MYNELTENDIKKMEKEIEYRTLVVRKEALEDVKTARAHGDLSENFEYHAAKREKTCKRAGAFGRNFVRGKCVCGNADRRKIRKRQSDCNGSCRPCGEIF